MGKLKLHTGPQGSYYYFKNKIFRHLDSGEDDAYLYFMPVNRAVRYFKKELLSTGKKNAILDPPVFTFLSFIQKIYHLFPQKKKVISQSMRLLLLENILISDRERLDYFRNKWSLSDGLILKADRMVEEFFQFGFRPQDFGEPPPTAEPKFADFEYFIHALYHIYGEQLIDESSLITEVVNQLDAGLLNEAFPNLKVIYVNGFGIISPPLRQFLSLSKDMCDVEIKLEYDPRNEELFRHTVNAYEALSQISDQIVDHSTEGGEIAPLLFNSSLSDVQKKKLKTKIYLQCTTNRINEVRFIATEIKKKFHEQNIPLNKIGITFPDIEKYTPLVRKVFNEFKIPFNLSTGFALAESPLIQSYLQVLKVAISQFNSMEVYKLALSPFLKEKLTEEAELIRQCGVRFGQHKIRDSWGERIRRIFKTMGHDPWVMNRKKNISDEKLDRMMQNIQSFQLMIEPLTSVLSAEEFQKIYIKVLMDLGLLNWYAHNNGALNITEKEREYRAFNRFIKILDQMVWILKYMHGPDPLNISDYYHYLTLIIENATYNLREWSDYGVQIMPRLEILSLKPDILFVGGLVEGEFPRLFTRDIFFNDDEREKIGLNASEDLLSQDRFLFYQLLTSEAKNIILSHPEFEAEQKLLPSTFLSALQEVSEEIIINREDPKQEYLSASSVLEYLSQSLKKGITTDDEKLFQSWISEEYRQTVDLWQGSIRLLQDRKGHSLITNYEGNLTHSEQIQQALKKDHLNYPFSITALESYAFCPMQYFLQRILHLEIEEDPAATITHLERGNVIHKILYTFYRRLNPEQRKTPWDYPELLEKIAADIFQSLPYNDILYTIEKEKYFSSPNRPGLWFKFLEVENETSVRTGFRPALFETGFGYSSGKKPGISSDIEVRIKRGEGDIKLYGKIDRIDIDAHGRFIVIDYKTGSGATKIKLTDIMKGLSLQLPVYIIAAQRLLAEKHKEAVPVGGIYYLVQDGDHCQKIPVFIDHKFYADPKANKSAILPKIGYDKNGETLTLTDVINNSRNFIVEYVKGIASGNFRHTFMPEVEKCTQFCSYRRICRKDTAKLLALKESEID
jgi:ATP-dependent helicase/DNAse subunit B